MSDGYVFVIGLWVGTLVAIAVAILGPDISGWQEIVLALTGIVTGLLAVVARRLAQ